MGIRNLHTFLKKISPMIYKEISLTEFAYKKIAIDFSIYLCKFKALYKEKWLDGFLNLMTCLRENEIHFIFIFDSKSPPEKDEEKKKRSLQRQKLKDKITLFENGIAEYQNNNLITPIIDFYIKKKPIDINIMTHLYTEIDKLKSNIFDIRSEDFESFKNLLDILHVPYYYAKSEAEATCAYLCIHGYVDAVYTEDTDIFAYGCPHNLHKINTLNNTIIMIEMSELLDSLNLTLEQFRDFCIMCGTDYNNNLPKIGPERAYKYIKDYKNIDNMTLDNLHILKHKRVRELFENKIEFKISEMYCGIPDEKQLQSFFFQNNCHFDFQKLLNSFINPKTELQFFA